MPFRPMAAFPPPLPANDRSVLVHWRADALRPRHAASRAVPRCWRAAAVDGLVPLGLMLLALWAAGFRF